MAWEAKIEAIKSNITVDQGQATSQEVNEIIAADHSMDNSRWHSSKYGKENKFSITA